MKKLHLVALAILALAGITMVGCGSKDNATQQADSTKKEVAGSSDNSQGMDNSITVGIPQDLDSLDPHTAVAAGTKEVLFNIYEGLVGPTKDGELIPKVASEYNISKDGLTYTFKLRKGIKFHNGNDVTVDDVIYSISRCAGKDGKEAIVPAFSDIKDISAKGDNIIVKLRKPSPEIIYSFTTAIIPKGSGEEEPFKPIGTGPFMVVNRVPNEELDCKKFDDYWGKKAYLDKVVFKVLPDPNMIATALKSGAIDLFSRLTFEQVKQVQENCNILTGSMNVVQGLYLNNKVKPLDNEKVRQAICYATDRQQILDLIFNGKGTIIGSSMVPYYKMYYMPELADYYKYNPEKAKELLKEAGYPNGFDMEITVPSNYKQHVDTATVLKQQLEQVGINVTIKPVEWSVWLSDVYKDRKYQSTVIAVDAKDMSAAAFLSRFQSDAPNNFINYSNKSYDKSYNSAQKILNLKEQAKYYKDCEKILTETAANDYIQDMANMVALNKNFEGYEFYPLYVLDMSTIKRVDNK